MRSHFSLHKASEPMMANFDCATTALSPIIRDTPMSPFVSFWVDAAPGLSPMSTLKEPISRAGQVPHQKERVPSSTFQGEKGTCSKFQVPTFKKELGTNVVPSSKFLFLENMYIS